MNSRFCSLLLVAASAYAQNATQAGKFVVEHPTLLNLGFEWSITGDANRNATVAVQYRPVGETAMANCVAAGADRRRERLPAAARISTTQCRTALPAAFLNLQPGTEYECRVQADRSRRSDRPDGADGQGEDTHGAAAL